MVDTKMSFSDVDMSGRHYTSNFLKCLIEDAGPHHITNTSHAPTYLNLTYPKTSQIF